MYISYIYIYTYICMSIYHICNELLFKCNRVTYGNMIYMYIYIYDTTWLYMNRMCIYIYIYIHVSVYMYIE